MIDKILRFVKRTAKSTLNLTGFPEDYFTPSARAKRAYYRKLSQFPVVLPYSRSPLLSILVPAYGQFDTTLKCLTAIRDTVRDIDCEVILADDASKDLTRHIKRYTNRLVIVRQKRNLGFLRNCNAAAERARGKYLLFLNNDAQLLPDAVSELVRALESDPAAGAAGGMILKPDGRLQEAGSIVWSDGICRGYGRDDSPDKPEYNFRRDTAYCSGAFLMTRTELFLEAGKFDERYAPAYYEDSDYCLSLHSRGFKVLYVPTARVVHHEFHSSSFESAAARMEANRAKFAAKWHNLLDKLEPSGDANELTSRCFDDRRKRLLYIEDRFPDPVFGSGFPRSYQLLRLFLELGYFVTVYPTDVRTKNGKTEEFERDGIETIYALGDEPADFEAFYAARKGYYDCVWISRPRNIEPYKSIVRRIDPAAKIVYDAEALFTVRESLYKMLKGTPLTQKDREKALLEELSLAKGADAVVTVSDNERRVYEAHGFASVHTLDHYLEARPVETPFGEREGILFVGAVMTDDDYNPNRDSILYFVKEILPLVRKELDCPFVIAGTNRSPVIEALAGEGIVVTGTVKSLLPYYRSARVFVAPTRYAAGTPRKLLEAASFGIPSVVTPLLAGQLNWTDGRETLTGADPKTFADAVVRLYTDESLWAHLRQSALERIGNSYDRKTITGNLKKILEKL